jgi:tetratricopeptide (TPR) repeat protein
MMLPSRRSEGAPGACYGRGPMRPIALLLVLFATAALAGPAPKPTADEAKRFSDALKRGRKLASAGNLDAAMAAFQEALAVMPEEPRALDEVGVVAWRKQELPLAEKTIRRAVELQSDQRKRAAALYNLGRILEDRGDKKGAVDAYARSLHDRPNKIVRERLGTLDAAAAQSLDPLTPKPMAGPVASVKAWCKEQRSDCQRDPDDTDADGKPKKPLAWSCQAKQKLAVVPPFLEAQVVTTSCFDDDRERHDVAHVLAARVGDGWYFFEVGEAHDSMRQTDELTSAAELKPLVAGGPPRVVVRTENQTAYRGMNATATTRMAIVGVGPSGKPSATDPFVIVTDSDEDDEETLETRAHHHGELPVRFLADDTVEVGTPAKKKGHPFDADTLGALVGKHKVAFP